MSNISVHRVSIMSHLGHDLALNAFMLVGGMTILVLWVVAVCGGLQAVAYIK